MKIEAKRTKKNESAKIQTTSKGALSDRKNNLNILLAMSLSELKKGQRAIIANVKGSGAFRQRLVEMGFVCGAEVKAIKKPRCKTRRSMN